LANLPKLQNTQLKKAVLFSLRRYSHNVGDTTREIEFLGKKADKVRLMVARAAIANKLGTTEDFYVMGTNYVFTKELLNDLIAQAKEDIKAEMATNVPSFMEIKHICACVYNAAQDSKVPEKTLNILSQEFNEDKIIAGGDHIAKFETTIEVDHAQAEKDKIKAAWADVNAKENKELRKEVETLKGNLRTLSASAEQMRASVCSRGVNKYKKMIAEMTANIHGGKEYRA
jgi:ADP-glucose pyrophosphorylase